MLANNAAISAANVPMVTPVAEDAVEMFGVVGRWPNGVNSAAVRDQLQAACCDAITWVPQRRWVAHRSVCEAGGLAPWGSSAPAGHHGRQIFGRARSALAVARDRDGLHAAHMALDEIVLTVVRVGVLYVLDLYVLGLQARNNGCMPAA